MQHNIRSFESTQTTMYMYINVLVSTWQHFTIELNNNNNYNNLL